MGGLAFRTNMVGGGSQDTALLPIQDILRCHPPLFWALHLHEVCGLQEAELAVSTQG